jgi:hypothetical protein
VKNVDAFLPSLTPAHGADQLRPYSAPGWHSSLAFQLLKFARYKPMSDTKKVHDEVVETSLAYVLSALAAVLAFLLVWLICSIAGSYRG